MRVGHPDPQIERKFEIFLACFMRGQFARSRFLPRKLAQGCDVTWTHTTASRDLLAKGFDGFWWEIGTAHEISQVLQKTEVLVHFLFRVPIAPKEISP